MSRIALEPDQNGSGVFTIASPNSNTSRTLNLPDAAGTVLVGGSPSASSTNTVTNKIAIVINGTTYYLLASTSGT
jgi:hypothetical protein